MSIIKSASEVIITNLSQTPLIPYLIRVVTIFQGIHILEADFHCAGRFPEGKALATSFAVLSPGSKALADPLGVAASITISNGE